MADIPQVLTFSPLSTTLQTVHAGRTKVVLEALDDAIADVVLAIHRLGGSGKVNDIEGIVWHHPDGRMVKIKGKDFGLKRGQKGRS